MTTIQVPITTVWDVFANAFEDPYFWVVSIVGTIVVGCVVRAFNKRSRRGF